MSAMLLCGLLFASLPGQAGAAFFSMGQRQVSGRWVVEEIVKSMQEKPADAGAQTQGCQALARNVLTTSKAAQDLAAAAGSIDAPIAAMRQFPDDKALQVQCVQAVGQTILFNRENGLKAGSLGGLNLTLAAYERWMEDPSVSGLGGSIGCYLDYCDENRAILRELGGVQLMIQNIKNNFHGQYSDWAYGPVLASLYGLSSGCWKNQDICFQEGFVKLAVQLMFEHTADMKIAEEALQAVKALMVFSPVEYRKAFANAGLAKALVKVLHENPADRGAVSLACGSLAMFIGQPWETSFQRLEFNAENQVLAMLAGAIEELLPRVASTVEVEHHVHPFNFDIDASYNADADCLDAMGALAYLSGTNQKTMVKGGLVAGLTHKLQQKSLNSRAQEAACGVLTLLATGGEVFSSPAKETYDASCP